MNNKSVVSSIWKLAEPIAKELELEIWDIKFLKEGSDWILRIFIDKKEGITIEDCEKMSRAIDKPLDDLDPISQNYCLEVSSPGIERELTLDIHFEKFISNSVIVRLIRPIEGGQKEIIGNLISFNKESIEINLENNNISLPRKNIAFVKLNDFKVD